MRWIGWFLFLLLGLIWLASELPSERASPPDDLAANNWRRTAQGWQQLALPAPEPPVALPAIHPAAFGTLEVLLVLFTAIVALFSAAQWRVGRRAEKSVSGGQNSASGIRSGEPLPHAILASFAPP